MIYENLPVCFRVDLDGFEQPLKIQINRNSDIGNFNIYLSTKNSEPNETNADL